eukprot:223761-Alexandrium_andersonii.AAC.1
MTFQALFCDCRRCPALSSAVRRFPALFGAFHRCSALSTAVLRFPPLFGAVHSCSALSSMLTLPKAPWLAKGVLVISCWWYGGALTK